MDEIEVDTAGLERLAAVLDSSAQSLPVESGRPGTEAFGNGAAGQDAEVAYRHLSQEIDANVERLRTAVGVHAKALARTARALEVAEAQARHAADWT
ncbi:hypothetical protein ACPPVT_03410 [Angustibacter sp. McL0619]|uniref:hypothetical protein n=1 Tax=Angustibacter sp. McL0619 TaxID=3415676 RepID=UPI003CF00CFA